MIVREVHVDHIRSGEEALKATERELCLTEKIVASMPKGVGGLTKVFFFKSDKQLTKEEIRKKYRQYKMRPVDPYALAAVNEAEPTFADCCPNVTYWKGPDNKDAYSLFTTWDKSRSVCVGFVLGRSGEHWWFAGVPE